MTRIRRGSHSAVPPIFQCLESGRVGRRDELTAVEAEGYPTQAGTSGKPTRPRLLPLRIDRVVS